MTNFTRECIAKGGFVAVGMRKSSQQNVGAATPTKICKRGRKRNINVKKKKTVVVDFVESTLLLGEDEPPSSGRVESAGLILAHCCCSFRLQLTRNENLSERVCRPYGRKI